MGLVVGYKMRGTIRDEKGENGGIGMGGDEVLCFVKLWSVALLVFAVPLILFFLSFTLRL